MVRQEHLSFEIVPKKKTSDLCLLPQKFIGFGGKQINGAWPGGDIVEVSEPNIFSKGGKVAFAALKLPTAK